MVALSDKLNARVVRRGESSLLSVADAMLALEELQASGACVYGADAFRLDDGIAIIGDIDVSPGGNAESFYAPVRAFVSTRPADTYVELVWD